MWRHVVHAEVQGCFIVGRVQQHKINVLRPSRKNVQAHKGEGVASNPAGVTNTGETGDENENY